MYFLINTLWIVPAILATLLGSYILYRLIRNPFVKSREQRNNKTKEHNENNHWSSRPVLCVSCVCMDTKLRTHHGATHRTGNHMHSVLVCEDHLYGCNPLHGYHVYFVQGCSLFLALEIQRRLSAEQTRKAVIRHDQFQTRQQCRAFYFFKTFLRYWPV